jgi:hypothetical protein
MIVRESKTGNGGPIAIVPGEPRARVLIKGLLAHLERIRRQQWIALDFPGEWIRSRPAVEAIALEGTGRATALEHIALEPMTPADEDGRRLLEILAPLEQEPQFLVPECFVDITVALGPMPVGFDLTLVQKALRGWCARHVESAPEGPSDHVITVSSTPVRLHLHKSACPAEAGWLSITPSDPPTTFATAVSDRLQARLSTLLAAAADRQVLLFEKNDRLWGARHLQAELEVSFEFPELSRIHEVWMVDVTRATPGQGPAFRRVLPVND